jgi:outer membrane protein OmpA-like peptidoglycan-associated protein
VSDLVRHRFFLGAGLGLVGCLVSTGAQAQEVAGNNGYSIDIEFLRPTFGHQGFQGVDAPMANRNLTLRYGTVMQYEVNPLTLVEAIDDLPLGAVVTNRFSAQFGASLDVNRVTFGLLVPMAANWGTEVDAFGADGFGLGDIGATVRIIVLQTPNDVFNVGVKGGLILPTGRPDAYMGEGRLRLNAGALASLSGGPFTVASDFGFATRSTVVTSEDFEASNEIVWGNAVRYRLPEASRLALSAQLLSRAGTANFLRGGAENGLEALGGLEIYPTKAATIGVGAGRGLTEGYGATDFRVLTSLVIEMPPAEPLPPQYADDEPPPPYKAPAVDVIIEEPIVPIFEEGEIVKQVGEEIFIRDMVEFVVDTNTIQEYSKPALKAVAALVNENPLIAHVVIEGHASREGSYEHNYTLAESRSRRIWEFFMELGVAKDRISYRGMGEVEPVIKDGMPILGEDEESLQQNRRVRFLVAKQFEADEVPTYPDSQVLPWNGEIVKVVKPPPPALPEPEPEPKMDEFGLPMGDDEEEDEAPKAPKPAPDKQE